MSTTERLEVSPRGSRAAWGLALVLALLVTVNGWLTVRHAEHTSQHDREHLFWTLCHAGGTAEQRRDAFLTLVADGNAVWAAARLERLDLNGLDLSGTYLAGAVFNGSGLARAHLGNCDLSGSSLQTVDLSQADLTGALLEEATALKAILDGAQLRGARLRAISLEQVSAHEANFVQADLSDAYLYMADFTDATLTNADLTGADLEAAVFRNADLALVRLDGAKLLDTDFTGSNWWRSRGLTSEQITELTLKYAPPKDAPESRQSDFLRWLKSQPSR